MVTAVPLIGDIAGQVQRPLLILLGAVGLVLLVACANVANLVLSRAVTRQREISVRAALGAGRRRLLQMLLVEGLLLTAAGGALGLFIGNAVVRAMPDVITLSLPGVQDVRLDARVVLFTFALSALTAIVFGLLPLVVSERRELTDLLREGGARSIGGARQHRLQAMLVVSSVALAVVLLASAGLLMRSFTKLMAVDTGIRAPRVLTMQVRLPQAGYDSGPAVRSFYQGLHDRVRAIPSVRAASIQTDLPLKGDGERRVLHGRSGDRRRRRNRQRGGHLDLRRLLPNVRRAHREGTRVPARGRPREPRHGDRQPCACGTLLARAGPDRQASEVGHCGVASAVADGCRRCRRRRRR